MEILQYVVGFPGPIDSKHEIAVGYLTFLKVLSCTIPLQIFKPKYNATAYVTTKCEQNPAQSCKN